MAASPCIGRGEGASVVTPSSCVQMLRSEHRLYKKVPTGSNFPMRVMYFANLTICLFWFRDGEAEGGVCQ